MKQLITPWPMALHVFSSVFSLNGIPWWNQLIVPAGILWWKLQWCQLLQVSSYNMMFHVHWISLLCSRDIFHGDSARSKLALGSFIVCAGMCFSSCLDSRCTGSLSGALHLPESTISRLCWQWLSSSAGLQIVIAQTKLKQEESSWFLANAQEHMLHSLELKERERLGLGGRRGQRERLRKIKSFFF